MTYFAHLPSLNTEPYTKYFLDTFIPKNEFNEKKGTSLYVQYFRKEFYTNPMIMLLDSTLQQKYNFPPIDYFSIFKHDRPQSIHHDGLQIPRYVSLNLPLSGFESTKMIFYKVIINTIPNVNDANYYLPETLEPAVELGGSNQWVLVDSSIPHNITNVDFNNPRFTLCLRFASNPTIDQLLSNINGPL